MCDYVLFPHSSSAIREAQEGMVPPQILSKSDVNSCAEDSNSTEISLENITGNHWRAADSENIVSAIQPKIQSREACIHISYSLSVVDLFLFCLFLLFFLLVFYTVYFFVSCISAPIDHRKVLVCECLLGNKAQLFLILRPTSSCVSVSQYFSHWR